MKRFISLVSLALLFGAICFPVRAQTSPAPQASVVPSDATTRQASNGDVFQRMTRVNAGLRSYKADLHIDVALKSFLPLTQSLDGAVYYRRPDEQAVVFQVVPALAGEFKKLYARIEPPDRWAAMYTFAILGDENGFTTFRLAPRKHGRVTHLDIKVDDATATIRGYVWNYEEGGYIAFDQSFTKIDGNYLVNGQVGRVELPSYKADVKSSLTNYRLNVAIDNGVFQHPN